MKVAQSCPIFCDPMDCSLAGSSVHGLLQVRILEWVAVPFSRRSSPPRDRTQISRTAGRFFTTEKWEGDPNDWSQRIKRRSLDVRLGCVLFLFFLHGIYCMAKVSPVGQEIGYQDVLGVP